MYLQLVPVLWHLISQPTPKTLHTLCCIYVEVVRRHTYVHVLFMSELSSKVITCPILRKVLQVSLEFFFKSINLYTKSTSFFYLPYVIILQTGTWLLVILGRSFHPWSPQRKKDDLMTKFCRSSIETQPRTQVTHEFFQTVWSPTKNLPYSMDPC